MEISTNDFNTIKQFSRMFHLLNIQEQNKLINSLENKRWKESCLAFTERGSVENLDEEQKKCFDFFRNDSMTHITRIKDQQINARQNNKETQLAKKMIKLHQNGQITDQILLMYGISGELPERQVYESMSEDEKHNLWSSRLHRRYGENWRSIRLNEPNMAPWFFGYNIIKNKCFIPKKINWRKEGF